MINSNDVDSIEYILAINAALGGAVDVEHHIVYNSCEICQCSVGPILTNGKTQKKIPQMRVKTAKEPRDSAPTYVVEEKKKKQSGIIKTTR